MLFHVFFFLEKQNGFTTYNLSNEVMEVEGGRRLDQAKWINIRSLESTNMAITAKIVRGVR